MLSEMLNFRFNSNMQQTSFLNTTKQGTEFN